MRLVHIQRKHRTEFPDTPTPGGGGGTEMAEEAPKLQGDGAGEAVEETEGDASGDQGEEDVPLHLTCPIGGDLLEDPVVISSGTCAAFVQ